MAKKSKKSVTKSKANATKSEGMDLIDMILEDHKPLKRLIKIMKNSDKYNIAEREEAFELFCPLLVCHAKPEEQTMYVYMKEEEELKEGGYEGDVEHQIADQLIEEAKRTENEDLWSARVKVLAESVEHHIEEEEEEMLPDFRKNIEKSARVELGIEYMRRKTALEGKGGEDSPSEKQMTKQDLKRDRNKTAKKSRANSAEKRA